MISRDLGKNYQHLLSFLPRESQLLPGSPFSVRPGWWNNEQGLESGGCAFNTQGHQRLAAEPQLLGASVSASVKWGWTIIFFAWVGEMKSRVQEFPAGGCAGRERTRPFMH